MLLLISIACLNWLHLPCTWTKGSSQRHYTLCGRGIPAAALVGGFKSGVGFADKKCRHCMANNDQIQKSVSICVHTVKFSTY